MSRLVRRRSLNDDPPPPDWGGNGLVWLLGGLAGLVAAAWYFNDDVSSEEGVAKAQTDSTPLQQLLATKKLAPNNGIIAHMERASGVDPRLLAFLDDWAVNGPFRLVVVDKGGLRTDDSVQAQLFASGASNASTLEDTPHGRGAAIDVAPYTRTAMGGLLWEPNFDYSAAFQEIANRGRARGLISGLNFALRNGGDGPHLEVPDWRSLPFPPAMGVV